MATNDERREVAAKLRELPIDMYDVNKSWELEGVEASCPDQTDYYLIHDALLGALPADNMHPCDYEVLHKRLADLIDPEGETMANNDLSRSVEFLRTADCRRCTCADCQEASAALFGKGNENVLCSIDDNGDAKPWRRLADLINPEPERRTCRNVGGEEWGFKCSECGGHTHGSPFHAPYWERDDLARRMSELFGVEDGAIASLHGSVPRYCPNCGAKVVEP